MTVVISAQNISAGYPGREVLKNITCEIESGEFIGIIGPNGAGKSTFIKVISGALAPLGGTVRVLGEDLRTIRTDQLARKMSVVHQAGENAVSYTVRDFAAMGLFPFTSFFSSLKMNSAGRVDEALELCGIGHLSKRPLAELSGGERQLASIARALVQNRELIILDEPVSHLDIKHVNRIMDILYRLNSEGSTVIAVLHDLNLAACYCGRIVAVKNGEVFFDGRTDEVVQGRNLEQLFGVECIVRKSPVSGRPFAYVIPERMKNRL